MVTCAKSDKIVLNLKDLAKNAEEIEEDSPFLLIWITFFPCIDLLTTFLQEFFLPPCLLSFPVWIGFLSFLVSVHKLISWGRCYNNRLNNFIILGSSILFPLFHSVRFSLRYQLSVLFELVLRVNSSLTHSSIYVFQSVKYIIFCVFVARLSVKGCNLCHRPDRLLPDPVTRATVACQPNGHCSGNHWAHQVFSDHQCHAQ